MLAQLGRVVKWTEAPLASAKTPRLLLSPQENRILCEVMERVHSELVRPFFALPDLGGMKWAEWVHWAEPTVQELIEKAGPILFKPEILALMEEEAGSGLGDETERIRAISPHLLETFLRSLATGFKTDLKWARRVAELGGAEAAHAYLSDKPASEELLRRRWFGDVGFGLAFLLLLETLGQDDLASSERVRFLVLKIKRMAAVSWSATRKLSKL